MNDDLRVRRTRKLLQDALIQLTVEKGFPNVTIRDLCERALVNRSTFYRHYLDKYDLLDQFMDEVYALTSDADFVAEKNGLLNWLNHIRSLGDFYRVMLGADGDARFIQRFRDQIERRYHLLYAQSEATSSLPVELRVSYISCASIGAILWWLEKGQTWTAEAVAAWMADLINANTGLTFPTPL